MLLKAEKRTLVHLQAKKMIASYQQLSLTCLSGNGAHALTFAHIANLNSARACAQSPCRCARQAHKFEHTAQWNQHELGHRTYAQRLFSGCTPEKNTLYTNTKTFRIAMSFSESVSNNINVYKPYRAVTVKNMCIRYSRFEVHTQMAMHVYPP